MMYLAIASMVLSCSLVILVVISSCMAAARADRQEEEIEASLEKAILLEISISDL